jgi:Ca2+-binding RTX toxin-like protein
MLRTLTLTTLFTVVGIGAAADAKTSHAGWPEITGVLQMHKADESGTMVGTPANDELLGGHGNDVIAGDEGRDVLWGDYKPSGNTTAQADQLIGGPGRDHIYASHGYNVIDAGPGNDYVKGHFGRGVIDCGPGRDVVYVSHRARSGWTIRNCERISYRTLGY